MYVDWDDCDSREKALQRLEQDQAKEAAQYQFTASGSFSVTPDDCDILIVRSGPRDSVQFVPHNDISKYAIIPAEITVIPVLCAKGCVEYIIPDNSDRVITAVVLRPDIRSRLSVKFG